MKNLVIRQDKTIRQKVYEHLREGILNCDLRPGERLVESDLAGRIGTSRTPVREALHTLEREGLVEAMHRVGYVVRPMSKNEVSELCEIRLALEGMALRWAMQKGPRKLARLLKENVVICEQKTDAGDIRAFVELDARFHDMISRVAGSNRLMEMNQSIRRYMLRYRLQSIYSENNVRRAIAGHRKVLKAVEEGNTKAAQTAIRAHIRQSRKDILYFGFRERKRKS